MAHSKRSRQSTQSSDQDNPEYEVNALESRFRAPSPEESVEEPPPHLFFDSLKSDFSELDTSDSETGSNLLTAMLKIEDMLRDPDWIPGHLRKKADIRAKSKIGDNGTKAKVFTLHGKCEYWLGISTHLRSYLSRGEEARQMLTLGSMMKLSNHALELGL
ncbi:hypothetical protein K503DRAFT_867709 [Rhizopogon vinicolor AM-OR11-026]|uniref:Uncharacterized protein n=1 Tax=Rhizopogon vinicolor AM-OR11-026 TaxID=1314800 RepID=A0A1B7MUE8_9AGAM|nr:hypothetical protein K503DRAFT_867709 [Rhizopogon vinicolor AM-OR11-026]